MDEITCPNCGSVIKSQFMSKIEPKIGTNTLCKRENYEDFELCWFCKTVPQFGHVISSKFLEFYQQLIKF